MTRTRSDADADPIRERNQRADRIAAKQPREVADAIRANIEELVADLPAGSLDPIEYDGGRGIRISPAADLRMRAIHDPLTAAQAADNWHRLASLGATLRGEPQPERPEPIPEADWRAAIDRDLIERAAAIPAGDGLSLLTLAVERMPLPLTPTERRPDPILPATMTMTAPKRGRRESLPLLGLTGQFGPRQLPIFGPEFDYAGDEFQASAFPVAMYRTAGRGAPLALRAMLYAILEVPPDDRAAVREFGRPWARVVDDVYPLGNYQPSRLWPGLRDALKALNADDRFMVPVPVGDGAWEGLRPVLAVREPLTGHRIEHVVFRVEFPPGSDRGPVADRATLFLAAADSTARFALASGLAVLWDRPGDTRVKPAAAAPFVQSLDFRRYHVLSRRALASLAYPNGWRGGKRRPQAEAEAVEHLHALAAIGYCRIERKRGGWRVMPGPEWIGWTNNQRVKAVEASDWTEPRRRKLIEDASGWADSFKKRLAGP